MELLKGLCSEVKAMLEEPTSHVEASRHDIVAIPGPEGTAGGNDDVGAPEIWPWSEGPWD